MSVAVVLAEWVDGRDRGGYTLVFEDLDPERGSVAERVRMAMRQEVNLLDCEDAYDLSMGGGFNWGDGLGLVEDAGFASVGLRLLSDASIEVVDHDEIVADRKDCDL